MIGFGDYSTLDLSQLRGDRSSGLVLAISSVAYHSLMPRMICVILLLTNVKPLFTRIDPRVQKGVVAGSVLSAILVGACFISGHCQGSLD